MDTEAQSGKRTCSRSQSKSVAEMQCSEDKNPHFFPGSMGMHHGHTHSAECRTRQARRGAWLTYAPPPPPPPLSSAGEAFLQPSRLQYGCTAVQHLCSGAAAAAEPRAPRRECCGCGCGAVRAGPGWGGLRGACRGRGQGLGLRDGQTLVWNLCVRGGGKI